MGFVIVFLLYIVEMMFYIVGYFVDSVDVLILNECGKEVEKGDKGILFVKII